MKTFSEFFGFSEQPFKRTPDIEFYYPTKMHEEALETLLYMVESDEAFAVLIGEPGTGKTITIRKFINELSPDVVVAYILFPNLSPSELFLAILEDFNVDIPADLSKNALFSRFRDFLIKIKEQGKKAVIIIDESQNLPIETLEELRILSNLETEKEKLLKIVLAGQPELGEKLESDRLRQLKQRITLYARLADMSENDIKNYINYHLAKAGRSSIRIQNGVIKKIAKLTGGNPRLVNTLMERAIIAGFLGNSYTITESHLSSAVSSVNAALSSSKKKNAGRLKILTAAAVIVLVCGVALSYGLKNKTAPNTPRTVAEAPLYAAENTGTETGQTYAAPSAKTPAEDSGVYAEAGSEVMPEETTATAAAPNAATEKEVGGVSTPVSNEAISAVQEQTSDTEKTFADPFHIANAEISDNPKETAISPAIDTTADSTENALSRDEGNAIRPGSWIKVKASSLNVRSDPSTEAEKVGSVLEGAEFIAREVTEYWVKIAIGPNKYGWVYKNYLEPAGQ